MRATIQVVLDEELERLIGAIGRVHTSAATSASTSGNGHYPRRIVTTAGEVDVRVGRSRDGGAANAPLGRYARRRPEIDAAITQAYVHGVSTRDMAGVTTVLGKRVGHSTVSRVTQRLEAEVETLRTARITKRRTRAVGAFRIARARCASSPPSRCR